MSVTRLFSPNKLIDYSPALWSVHVHLLVSTRHIRTSVKETRDLRPTSISFIEKPPLLDYQLEAGARLGAAKNETRWLSSSSIANLLSLYGKNTFNIPIPASGALFAEHATAPFFVFQIFCVALWCLDEYWYYSLFTLFMRIMFECTVVWQRVRTLTEFRSMSIEPYPIQCYRDGKWVKVQTDELLPGDVVSLGKCLCSPKEFLY